MSRILPLSAAFLSAALTLAPQRAAAQPRSGTGASYSEESLLTRIHELNVHEMQLGRLAQRRGESRLVRRLGARLEDDHDEADARLLRRAGQRGLYVDERGASAEHKARAARLESLEGAQFDRAFAETVLQDQARAAALLRSERALTADRDTRRTLDRLLPLFDEHRDLAAFARGREAGEEP